MKKLLFVFNRHAGKGQINQNLSEIINTFTEAGYEVTAYPTQKRKDGYHKIKEMADEFDIVVCSGGDGTLDEAVSGMMQREAKRRRPIGYIPAGSTNDFACSLGIPTNMLTAADTVVEGVPFQCDVGCFNEENFVYIAAFGLFTDVSYETKQEMKNVLGHLAYILEGAKRLYNIPSYRMRVLYDGNEIEDEFICGMVTNSKSVGGFRSIIGKNVVFDDGEFEVTLIKTPKNPIALSEIVASFLSAQMNSSHMYTFRAKEVTFISDGVEIPWTRDGEYGGSHEEVVVANGNRKLEIMVPKRSIAKIAVDPKKYDIQ